MHREEWEAGLVEVLRGAFESGYGKPALREEKVIANVVAAISKVPVFNHALRSITVEGAFLHGPRSMVRYKHPSGKAVKVELADLMMLASFAEQGKLTHQRVALIQAKKASAKGQVKYDIKAEQLHLLRAFPRFDGVSGVLKGHVGVHLVNTTGHLGMYLFLSPPGEVSLLTARGVHGVEAGRRHVYGKDLNPSLIAGETSIEAWDSWLVGRLLGRIFQERAGIEGVLGIEHVVRAWTLGKLGQEWVPSGPDPDMKLAAFVRMETITRKRGVSIALGAIVSGPERTTT